jgi:DNA-binding CsgD family transcriptional regulator
MQQGLSERELEFARLVAEGMRNSEVAQALWISEGTVRTHLQNIFAKLEIHNRTQLALWFHGLEGDNG